MKLECSISFLRVKAYSYLDLPIGAFLIGVQLALNHVDHDFITDKATLVHDLLGLSTQLGLLCDLGSQHVASSLVFDQYSSHI